MAVMEWTPPLRPSEENPTGDAAPGVEDLQAALRPAWVDVDLSALEHNLAAIRRRIAETSPHPAQVMAVVKARLAGRADMGKVSALVKAKLAG